MKLCPSKEERFLQNIITKIAKKTYQVYPSRYQDIEDYIQEGYLALYQAKRQWLKCRKGTFLPYAYIAISRSIRKSAR